jgi:hypothetical protein
MSLINSSEKENISPKPADDCCAKDQQEASKQKQRGDDYQQQLYNANRREHRGKATISKLISTVRDAQACTATLEQKNEVLGVQKEKLERQRNTLRKRRDRAPAAKGLAVRKALKKAETRELCKSGVVSDQSRDMVRELVIACRVPVGQVNEAIQAVSGGLGLSVPDSISVRTVRRAVTEAGLAANIQLAHEVVNTNCKKVPRL